MKPEQNATAGSSSPTTKFSKVTRILASVAIGRRRIDHAGRCGVRSGAKNRFRYSVSCAGNRHRRPAVAFIPTRLTYRLVPEGGPEAFLMVVTACALIFWSLVFAISYRYAFQKKREAL